LKPDAVTSRGGFFISSALVRAPETQTRIMNISSEIQYLVEPAKPKSGRGGARRNSGRKKLSPEKKRKMVSVKVLPDARVEWKVQAGKAGVSQGAVVEWLMLAPEAHEARLALCAHAREFLAPKAAGKKSDANMTHIELANLAVDVQSRSQR
jgi:hypothetical protein